MAEVFSNSPCMLGKRVLSPHLMSGQHEFSSSKKRRLGHGADQGSSERSDSEKNHRPPSPVRAGKRARPLSPLQPSSDPSFFGFSHHQQQQQQQHGREDLELSALRREVGALRAHAAEKDSGIASAREENSRLREGLGMYQKEVERLTSENRILKRAVGIQNTKGKEVESQLHGLQQAGVQAAEYIKRLEQTNYALSVRVQSMGSAGPSDFMGGQRPPDVF